MEKPTISPAQRAALYRVRYFAPQSLGADVPAYKVENYCSKRTIAALTRMGLIREGIVSAGTGVQRVYRLTETGWAETEVEASEGVRPYAEVAAKWAAEEEAFKRRQRCEDAIRTSKVALEGLARTYTGSAEDVVVLADIFKQYANAVQGREP